MPESDNSQLTQLRQQIEAHFNEEELRALCFELGVDYEDLGGRGKAAHVLELINWAKRNGRVSELMALVKAARPNTPDIVALLPPHHIPYRRNELFTGREEWLSLLHDALHRDEPVAVTQAVAGLGGVGKTQLALAYCYRHLDDYDLIQWLRADDVTTLGTALAELGYRLGLARREVTDQPTLHQLALNWLHTTDKRWLLVYDNADAIQPNDLRQFLPKLGHGACLITSRNPNWGSLAHTLNLTHFSDNEAVAFLLGQPAMTEEEIAAHPQGEDVKKLAHLLGNLPLALEHARAYVEETGCALADYADYFESEREALWGKDLPAPANYDEKTITTTWELAFAQARQTPGAAALLNLCCFLAPDEIPLDLILAAVGADDELPLPEELVTLANSKLQLDKAIAALRRYSLLTRDGNTVSLHRLVQTVARDQMPPEIRQRWLTTTVTFMKNIWSFDQYDLDTWAESANLLPHLLAVILETETISLETTDVASLNGQADFYLSYIGNFSAARPFSERALAIDEKALGSDHPTVAIRLNNLGQLLQEVGEYEAARPYLERALTIDEKSLGPDHPDVAIDLNNLGQLLQAVGEYQAARPYMEHALAIDEKALGPDHPSVGRDLNNLGQLLREVGEYEAARPYLERALAIWEKALGADHPQVAVGNNNLGQLLQDLGAYEAARPYLERALAIDEKALSPDHPDVARDLNNLGQLLKATGAYEAARPYLERALAIWEKALGADHPQVAVGNNNLGQLLKAVGEYEAARPYMERALAIWEKALGPDHPQVAIGNNNLGMLMQTMGDFEEAKIYLEQALQIKEKSLPPNHPSTIIGRNNLAALLAEMEGKS